MIRSAFEWNDKKVDRLEHAHSRTSPVSIYSTFIALFLTLLRCTYTAKLWKCVNTHLYA